MKNWTCSPFLRFMFSYLLSKSSFLSLPTKPAVNIWNDCGFPL